MNLLKLNQIIRMFFTKCSHPDTMQDISAGILYCMSCNTDLKSEGNVIKYNNIEKNRCVICDKFIVSTSYVVCQKCNSVSKIGYKLIGEEYAKNVKSGCCNASVNVQQKITCNEWCHLKFIHFTIEEKGEFQKIVNIHSGKAHKVPTRLIMEDGVTQLELESFPVWEDEK